MEKNSLPWPHSKSPRVAETTKKNSPRFFFLFFFFLFPSSFANHRIGKQKFVRVINYSCGEVNSACKNRVNREIKRSNERTTRKQTIIFTIFQTRFSNVSRRFDDKLPSFRRNISIFYIIIIYLSIYLPLSLSYFAQFQFTETNIKIIVLIIEKKKGKQIFIPHHY